jgi:hypothetical protein
LIGASDRGWSAVFVAASILNIAAAILALFVLKPMRARMKARSP